MVNYKYKCECGFGFEENRGIEDRNTAICPQCGETPKQDYSAHNVGVVEDTLRDADGKLAGFNPGLGQQVDSKSQMKRVAASKGLKWIGDDPIPKPKQKKAEVDWNAVHHDLDEAGVKDI